MPNPERYDITATQVAEIIAAKDRITIHSHFINQKCYEKWAEFVEAVQKYKLDIYELMCDEEVDNFVKHIYPEECIYSVLTNEELYNDKLKQLLFELTDDYIKMHAELVGK